MLATISRVSIHQDEGFSVPTPTFSGNAFTFFRVANIQAYSFLWFWGRRFAAMSSGREHILHAVYTSDMQRENH